MMRKWVCLFLLVLSFPFFQVARAQNISNEGTDFWAVFPTHDAANDNINSLANIAIFITSKSPTEVTVTCGVYTMTLPIPANKSVGFYVPRESAYIGSTEGNTVLSNKGIHIVVNDGKTKVAAYAHIYAGKRSAASLILPVEAVGQRYYSMNYILNNEEPGRTYIVLVATEADTKVLIHTNDNIVPVSLPNVGDIYEYIVDAGVDIAGTYVEVDASSACKKFAMFSGVTSTKIGTCPGDERRGSRDPLYQQLYPVNSWGKNYGIVPFKDRNYFLRIIAQEDATSVNFNGTNTPLKKGEVMTTPVLTEAGFVSSNKNISVAQFALSYACMGKPGENGDPEMVLLNPVEFNIKQVTLFSSSKEEILEKYINVFMETSGTASFRIDGSNPVGNWAAIPSKPLYSFIQIPVENESITLTADIGFNAIAYGFGPAESYAYSAGTNLASTTYLLITNTLTNKDNPSACIDEPSNFKVVLPYLVSKLTWTLDAEAPYRDLAPKPTQVILNDQTFYSYTYSRNIQYTETGSHNMIVVAELAPTVGGCPGTKMEFVFHFSVDALPKPIFKVDLEVCPDVPIQFNDESISNTPGKSISYWQWDFNDGSPIEYVKNPIHTFKTSGEKTIRLSVGTESGCMSDVLPLTTIVRPKMTAKFEVAQSACINNDVEIKDISTIEPSGKIVKWYWDFGDGREEKSNNLPFTHKYAQSGNYTITLITQSEAGDCKSIPFPKSILIHDLPKADFKIPQACQSDVVIFENTSTDVDETIGPLSYLWNFDAGNPNAVNNTSINRKGVYKYAKADNYTVTLTVTNSFGCSTVIAHDITINGANPTADFDLDGDKNQLCSSRPVKVTNKSTVSFGKITRLEWYPDFDNNPAWVIIDDNPVYGRSQEIKYDIFDSPTSKTYNVKLKAFSGSTTGSCYSLSNVPPITILGTPILDFNDMQPICVNADRFQLTQASEQAGLPGKGVYSGMGVINVGNDVFYFDPAVAGANSHDITYTFTADNGCPESKTKTIIVLPKPTVTVDQDIYVLAGGQKTIETEATGAISYKWEPSYGLNKADIPNPIVTPVKDTKYTLTITSGQGCFESKPVYVHVLSSIEVANTFSPNGDGVNDFWNIKYIETYPNSTVEIFDRYGAKVFFSRGYSVPFDGNFKNQPLPVGTYYYIIDPKNGKQRKSGSLTLIR